MKVVYLLLIILAIVSSKRGKDRQRRRGPRECGPGGPQPTCSDGQPPIPPCADGGRPRTCADGSEPGSGATTTPASTRRGRRGRRGRRRGGRWTCADGEEPTCADGTAKRQPCSDGEKARTCPNGSEPTKCPRENVICCDGSPPLLDRNRDTPPCSDGSRPKCSQDHCS